MKIAKIAKNVQKRICHKVSIFLYLPVYHLGF
jgi:uncharacterized alkaline shock family protein YloU